MEAYHSPQLGEVFDEVLFRDGAEPDVVGGCDGSNFHRIVLRQKLRRDEAVVAAANLQEGDGKAIDVHLHVVRLERQNLRRGVDLWG